MQVTRASLNHYSKILKLYRKFLLEVYASREVKEDYFLAKVVQSWFEAKVDLFIVEYKSKVIGFSVSYVDTNGGTLSPVYRAEISYVLPKYRKTSAGYKLLHLPINLAKEYNLNVVSKAAVYNGTDKLHKKLGGIPNYIEMELQNVK